MPCACKNNNLPSYPVADNWGPVLWTILHALAEKTTKLVVVSSRDDERRQWINLIQIMPKMIPCADCRDHVELWILQNPITAIKTMPDSEFHDWMVSWFYRFHEAVNKRTGKPSFDKALLTEKYGKVPVGLTLKSLKPFIETAIRLSGITLLPWNKWSGYVLMLCSLYGL